MGITTKKWSGRIQILASCLVFCALCLMSGHSHIVLAQDADINGNTRSRAVRVEAVEPDDDVYIDDGVYIDTDVYIGGYDEVYVGEEETKSDEDEATPDNRQRRSQRGERSGDAFPPEAREMMEKDGISPADLMGDSELREKFSKRMREKREEDSQTDGEPGAEKKKKPAEGEEEAPREGLERYTSVIVKKNLFLNLGSDGEKKGASYALTAVISDSSDKSRDKAIIERQDGGESYYLSEGDTFAGGIELVEIEDKKVKLDNSGEEMTLTLGEGTGGGGGSRGGGGGRRGGSGKRGAGGGNRSSGGGDKGDKGDPERNHGGGGNFDASRLPPFARRVLEQRGISMEQLRNNPQLQQELRREFMGSRGGDGASRMRRSDGGRRGRGRRDR